jgi:hypothetical protein
MNCSILNNWLVLQFVWTKLIKFIKKYILFLDDELVHLRPVLPRFVHKEIEVARRKAARGVVGEDFTEDG